MGPNKDVQLPSKLFRRPMNRLEVEIQLRGAFLTIYHLPALEID